MPATDLRFVLVAGMGLVLGACAKAPEGPPQTGTGNPDVVTPVERPADAALPPDSVPDLLRGDLEAP